MRGVLDWGAAPATGAREMCRGLPFCWTGVAAAVESAAAAIAVELALDAADLAWLFVAAVCCARDALIDEGGGGVAALAGGCSVVVESHRERLGRRKAGGRRVMGLRSSSAVRKRDLLIFEGCRARKKRARDWRPLCRWDVESQVKSAGRSLKISGQ